MRALALRLLPEGQDLLFAVDDTLGRKTGRHIRGAGMRHDPLRSTPARPVFCFGHSWVALSIIVPLPFVKRRFFAIPILFRLCRGKAKKRPPAFVVYSLTVLWYAEHGEALRAKWSVKRPWYRKKKGSSFADMLATLRQASWAEANSLDPARRPGSKPPPGERIPQLQTWLSAAG